MTDAEMTDDVSFSISLPGASILAPPIRYFFGAVALGGGAGKLDSEPNELRFKRSSLIDSRSSTEMLPPMLGSE
jgi:hypothetical protein